MGAHIDAQGMFQSDKYPTCPPGKVPLSVNDPTAQDLLWEYAQRQRVVDSGATVVIRPDSGDPVQVVCATLEGLAGRFGTTTNSRGFKVLRHVRVIQGDGINLESIGAILRAAKDRGFSADNLAFGMGGALLQGVNRDTQRFAMKCSSVTVDGAVRDVFKDPVTDRGKRSLPGRLDVINHRDDGMVATRLAHGDTAHSDTAMVTVFEDGNLTTMHRFDEVRARSGSWS